MAYRNRSKVRGSGAHIPPRERHHWWPEGLSAFWADGAGLVNRLSWDGSVLAAPPKTFGAITNAHKIDLKGPWGGTIEPVFNDADQSMPHIVRHLLTLRPPTLAKKASGRMLRAFLRQLRVVRADRSIANRLTPVTLSLEQRELLGDCLASLIVRSPSFRNRIALVTNDIRERFGLPAIDDRDSLVAGNIHNYYPQIIKTLSHGAVVLLFAGEGEFIAGEGHLHNLDGRAVQGSYKCLVPLTPELAVLAFNSAPGVPRGEVVACALNSSEVDEVNYITQVYTRDYVFYRTRRPTVVEPFQRREFREFKHQEARFVEEVLASLATLQGGSLLSRAAFRLGRNDPPPRTGR